MSPRLKMAPELSALHAGILRWRTAAKTVAVRAAKRQPPEWLPLCH